MVKTGKYTGRSANDKFIVDTPAVPHRQPALAESMAKDGGVLGGMLSQNKELAASMARTVLDKMPQEKKDELLVQLLNRNRDKLLEKGRTLAAENGVRLQLCDVSARKF